MCDEHIHIPTFPSVVHMLISLTGRIAFVTGGASGIGKAVATGLVNAGANVVVADRNGEEAKKTSDALNHVRQGCSIGIACDVTDRNSVQEAVQKAKSSLSGSLTCAVNCAGITADGFMIKMDDAQWEKVLNVNLKGTFLVTQAVSRAIIDDGMPHGGSIVNVASIVGKVGNIGQANYTASKAGVVAFSKTSAKELARYNIRVNSVLPGFIDTPMAQAVPEKVLTKMLGVIPLNRLGRPEEIADLSVYLCSDKSSYITGAAIEATGGQFM